MWELNYAIILLLLQNQIYKIFIGIIYRNYFVKKLFIIYILIQKPVNPIDFIFIDFRMQNNILFIIK
jgi:hypothetical protein